MNAAELCGGHFPVFELGAVEPFAQAAQHERVVEFFLLGKSSDIDGLETGQELTRVFEILGDGLVGKIAQPAVVAVVSNLGGKFGLSPERVLPLVGEQAIEFGAPGLECRIGNLGKKRDE